MGFVVSDMDSTGVLIGQIYRKMQKATHSFVNTVSATDLTRRQSDGGDTTVLSSGAIIGIAVTGSAILFGILAMIIIHCVRLRHKRSKKPRRTRDLDLSDDNEEDIFEALRSTRPPELNLTRPQPLKLPDRKDSARNEWDEENKLFGPPLASPQLMPPAYAFQVTGLRDSWPLAGWVPASGPAITIENRSITEANSPDQRSSYSALRLPADHELTWPQRTLSRSTSGRITEDRSIRRSNHSANPSIISVNMLSYNRRSVSDNQLTSILRSTSQRLRDAQRHPMSRATSVMSQESGAPPALKPPSPPAAQRGGSQEALLDLDDTLDAESVRSSVLNATGETPSPLKRSVKRVHSTTGPEKPTATAPYEFNPDIMSLSKVSDLFALAPLTKQGALVDQGPESQLPSFMDNSSTEPCKDNGIPREASRREVIANDSQPSNKISPANDPFIYSKDLFESRPLSVKIPRSRIWGSPDIEQEFFSRGPDSLSFPLHDISGNKRSPNKPRSVSTDASLENNLKHFQWSSDVQSLMESLGQKPARIKQKGHRRRRTVRFSHDPRPVSVGVVFEETESDFVTPQTLKTTDKLASGNVASRGSLASEIEIPDLRLPKIPLFQPSFLAIPPTETQLESKRSSGASYSATLSFYDYYSSGGPSSPSQAGSPLASPSPTPSIKKSRRRGRNFSIDTNKANSLALTSFPPLKPNDSMKSVEYDGTLASLIRDPSPEKSVLESDSPFSSRPAGNGRLFGPRALPQPSPVDSVTSSVSLLRRMNSEVSTYSTSSLLSDQSRGSPMISQFRNSGTSPTRRTQWGTFNYLSIGNKSSYSRSRRGRRRELGATPEVETNVDEISATQSSDQELVNLKMPVVEYSPTPPSLGYMTNPERQNDQLQVPHRPKAPIAQLRPVGTSMLTPTKCQTCNEPLLPSSVSQHHDNCLLCTTCKTTLEHQISHTIDNLRYCSDHYLERIKALPGNKIDKISVANTETHTNKDGRWSNVMATPQKTSVRRESRLEMPAPKGLSPKSVIEWRGSLGLYDDLGFLKSSPDRIRNLNLNMSPSKGFTLGDLGLKV